MIHPTNSLYRKLLTMQKTTFQIYRSLDLSKVLDSIVEEMAGMMDSQVCVILLLDENRQFVPAVYTTDDGIDPSKLLNIDYQNGPARMALDTREMMIIDDMMVCPLFPHLREIADRIGVRSEWAIPLEVNQEPLGVIILLYPVPKRMSDIDEEIARTFANHAAMAIHHAKVLQDKEKLLESQAQLKFQLIQTFSRLIDAKDPYTQGHSEKVAYYAMNFGTTLNLTNQETDGLYILGLLHDIGKVGIPDSILTKPGRLTMEEFDQIKQHPVIGEKIISAIDAFQYLLPGIRHHHERMDGTGYPDGLKGEQIHFWARMLAICDAYDAMTSDRSYRVGLNNEAAFEQLRKHAGTQFDADLVPVFIKMIIESEH